MPTDTPQVETQFVVRHIYYIGDQRRVVPSLAFPDEAEAREFFDEMRAKRPGRHFELARIDTTVLARCSNKPEKFNVG
jgi:hypothetical protein